MHFICEASPRPPHLLLKEAFLHNNFRFSLKLALAPLSFVFLPFFSTPARAQFQSGGLNAVFSQLEEKHGYFVVWGDDGKCEAHINADATEFTIQITDGNSVQDTPTTLTITNQQRMLIFTITPNLTTLNLRDRINAASIADMRDVDVSIKIEEFDGNKVTVTYEDRISHQRHTCSGFKSKEGLF